MASVTSLEVVVKSSPNTFQEKLVTNCRDAVGPEIPVLGQRRSQGRREHTQPSPAGPSHRSKETGGHTMLYAEVSSGPLATLSFPQFFLNPEL